MITPGVLLLTGAGLGLTYAAAPGAVNTEALRRGVARGARSTLLVEAGSLIGDGLWAALALTGVVLIGQHRAILVALGIAGGCFLLRMAWLALHDAWVSAKPPATSAAARGDFATGAFFGLANPVGLAFWSGLGSGIAAEASGAGFVLFFAGFFAGAVLWCAGITMLIGWGRRWVRPSFFRWVNALCGLALGYFGARLLWTSVEEVWLARARGVRALWSARAS